MSELDKVDNGILAILLKDGRKPYTEIAKELGVSDPTIHVRIKRMEDLGVMKGFTVRVDPSKLGRPISAVIMIGVMPGHLAEVATRLTAMDVVADVLEVFGDYEIVVRVYTDTQEILRNTVNDIRLIPGVTRTVVNNIFKSWKGTCGDLHINYITHPASFEQRERLLKEVH